MGHPWRFLLRHPDPRGAFGRLPRGVVPEGIGAEKGWRVLRVAGAMDFSLVGVLASLTGPLAEAGVALFALSTFDTDYLLVKDEDLGRSNRGRSWRTAMPSGGPIEPKTGP